MTGDQAVRSGVTAVVRRFRARHRLRPAGNAIRGDRCVAGRRQGVTARRQAVAEEAKPVTDAPQAVDRRGERV